MRALFRLEGFEDVRGMAGDLDLAPRGADHACRVDQEGAAFDADEFPAVQLLRLEHAERVAEPRVGVPGQGEAEALLLATGPGRFQRVERNTDHVRAQLAELRTPRHDDR